MWVFSTGTIVTQDSIFKRRLKMSYHIVSAAAAWAPCDSRGVSLSVMCVVSVFFVLYAGVSPLRVISGSSSKSADLCYKRKGDYQSAGHKFN